MDPYISKTSENSSSISKSRFFPKESTPDSKEEKAPNQPEGDNNHQYYTNNTMRKEWEKLLSTEGTDFMYEEVLPGKVEAEENNGKMEYQDVNKGNNNQNDGYKGELHIDMPQQLKEEEELYQINHELLRWKEKNLPPPLKTITPTETRIHQWTTPTNLHLKRCHEESSIRSKSADSGIVNLETIKLKSGGMHTMFGMQYETKNNQDDNDLTPTNMETWWSTESPAVSKFKTSAPPGLALDTNAVKQGASAIYRGESFDNNGTERSTIRTKVTSGLVMNSVPSTPHVKEPVNEVEELQAAADTAVTKLHSQQLNLHQRRRHSLSAATSLFHHDLIPTASSSSTPIQLNKVEDTLSRLSLGSALSSSGFEQPSSLLDNKPAEFPVSSASNKETKTLYAEAKEFIPGQSFMKDVPTSDGPHNKPTVVTPVHSQYMVKSPEEDVPIEQLLNDKCAIGEENEEENRLRAYTFSEYGNFHLNDPQQKKMQDASTMYADDSNHRMRSNSDTIVMQNEYYMYPPIDPLTIVTNPKVYNPSTSPSYTDTDGVYGMPYSPTNIVPNFYRGDDGSNLGMLLPPNCEIWYYEVEFKRYRRSVFIGRPNYEIGNYIKVEADRGQDLGHIVRLAPDITTFRASLVKEYGEMNIEKKLTLPLKRILRLATNMELTWLAQKFEEEKSVLEVCRTKVCQRMLPMKVIDAEFQFDRHKLTFYFVADRRIDFRELVRDLFAVYKTRIWLQQVTLDTRKRSEFQV